MSLLHIMLNFVGQHHTGGISYTSINNNDYFQGIYALCKHTISLTNFTSFFQFAGEMSNSHMYKSPKYNLQYIPIIWLLTVWDRFIFQKTERK
jgi:hypothetical protein